jgi:hypothetical protein
MVALLSLATLAILLLANELVQSALYILPCLHFEAL